MWKTRPLSQLGRRMDTSGPFSHRDRMTSANTTDVAITLSPAVSSASASELPASQPKPSDANDGDLKASEVDSKVNTNDSKAGERQSGHAILVATIRAIHEQSVLDYTQFQSTTLAQQIQKQVHAAIDQWVRQLKRGILKIRFADTSSYVSLLGDDLLRVFIDIPCDKWLHDVVAAAYSGRWNRSTDRQLQLLHTYEWLWYQKCVQDAFRHHEIVVDPDSPADVRSTKTSSTCVLNRLVSVISGQVDSVSYALTVPILLPRKSIFGDHADAKVNAQLWSAFANTFDAHPS